MLDIDAYVAQLAAVAPGISEVWLIGSRANGTAREDSDWDLLVFGDAGTLSLLKAAAAELHRDDVDCLVFDTDGFTSAWGPREKSLSFRGLAWRRVSADRAIYTETKPGNAGDLLDVVSRERNALLLWPKANR